MLILCVMGWMFVFLKYSYVELLTSSVIVFGDGAFEMYWGLHEVMRLVPSSYAISVFIRKDTKELFLASHMKKKRLCDHRASWYLPASQEKRLKNKSYLVSTLTLNFPAFRTVRKEFLLFKLPSLLCFIMASWADAYCILWFRNYYIYKYIVSFSVKQSYFLTNHMNYKLLIYTNSLIFFSHHKI